VGVRRRGAAGAGLRLEAARELHAVVLIQCASRPTTAAVTSLALASATWRATAPAVGL
jgi:hypothetical protein